MSSGPAVPGAQTVLASRYRLERPLGRGGMAEVWAAHDEVLDRPIAVKILSSRFRDDDEFQQRFRREAQHSANLNHPNIVAVYDTGSHGGMPYIVMELVAGRSLQQVLERGGLTEQRALEVCAEVCAALAYAHDRGLVHRDVKPGNILIADDGAVKVTDFGIARAIGADNVTQTAAVLGTAAYLSPEQAQGAAVDERSDLYSLGVVLYEMLTDRPPFTGDSAVGVAYQHVQEDPIPPREIDPSISPAAEAISMKALAKNAANRYRSARAMRDDLLRAMAGDTVTAPAVLLADETTVLDRGALTTRQRPPPSPRDERRRRTVGYVLLGLLALAAVAASVWLLASLVGGPATVTRTVPNVREMTFEGARRLLEAHGLEAREVGLEFSRDVEQGRVIRQEPEPGTQVDDGTVVGLVLSRGPEPVTVPDVEGDPEEEARAELRDAELVIGERRAEPSEEIERGRVIRTEPAAGEEVPRGTAVALVVSLGEPRETVPNVVGQDEDVARFQLEERGFEVEVETEPSDEFEEGKVIRQDPEGNTDAPPGSEVTIVVSEGPAEPTPTPSPTPSPDEPSPTPTGPDSSPTGILPAPAAAPGGDAAGRDADPAGSDDSRTGSAGPAG